MNVWNKGGRWRAASMTPVILAGVQGTAIWLGERTLADISDTTDYRSSGGWTARGAPTPRKHGQRPRRWQLAPPAERPAWRRPACTPR